MFIKAINALMVSVFVVAVLVGTAVVATNPKVVSAEEVTSSANTDKNNEDEKVSYYEYVAQRGDSYTKIARKAVQTYGIANNINIGEAGIVFAETNLTIAEGSPLLNVGQEVKVREDQVAEWVQKATKLSDSEKNLWQYYVQFIDFNTDKVGSAS